MSQTMEWTLEASVDELDHGLYLLDLGFQNRKQVVAAYLLVSDDELVLIETGPGSTIDHLRRAMRRIGFTSRDLTRIFVTHIHLDHAGAAGLLARENPALTVHVHPFGAPHLVDPTKLINSATRIYGDQMGPLWGEFAPIPENQVVPFEDEQVLRVAGRDIQVYFTPGHAWHHVAFWDRGTGTLFTGDVGGVRMPGQTYVCAPTPPPDLDPGAWANSVARMEALHPRRLCLTHFGPVYDPGYHLSQVMPEVEKFIGLGGDLFERGADQDRVRQALTAQMTADLGGADPEVLANYEMATPAYMAAMGIERYVRKRNG
ncbi:MAG: MBL fold metallo-hydrolase [Thermomicrobiales bacterium]|nr:MBL fold metallo-hydrolase [Thermomicrobiales bacterium]MCO5220678.1 MBL fold metallo-hydrolase [Thermomicrobiales bacterium]